MGRSRRSEGPSAEQAAARSKRKKAYQASSATASNDTWQEILGGTKGGLYQCNFCQRDITGEAHIKCGHCVDFDLCLECFSVGASIHPHKADHPYRIIDDLSFPLFNADWSAEEESLLLEGIGMYGMGNWNEIAEHVGTGKTSQQCHNHYVNDYLLSPCAPVPDMSKPIDRVEAAERRRRAAAAAAAAAEESGKHKKAKTERVEEDDGSGDEAPRPKEGGEAESEKGERPTEASKAQMHGSRKDVKKTAKDPETAAEEELKELKESTRSLGTSQCPKPQAAGAGAGPASASGAARGGRGWRGGKAGEGGGDGKSTGGGVSGKGGPDSGGQGGGKSTGAGEAEVAPGTASKGPATSSSTVAEQDEIAAMYNVKRHEFDPEYDNDAEMPLAELDFKDSDSAQDRELKLRLLRIYNSRLDERARRKEFVLSRGFTTTAKLQAEERRAGTPEERQLMHRLRKFARFMEPPEYDEFVDGILQQHRLKKRILFLQEARKNGCRLFGEARAFFRMKATGADGGAGECSLDPSSLAEAVRAMEELESKAQGRASGALPQATQSQSQAQSQAQSQGQAQGGNPSQGAACVSLQGGSQAEGDPAQLRGGDAPGGPGEGEQGQGGAQAPPAISVASMPGAELLSDEERELCQSKRLLPHQYLDLKDALIKESMFGDVRLDDFKETFKVSMQAVEGVFALLSKNKWMQTQVKVEPSRS